jgi:hypothetical protein
VSLGKLYQQQQGTQLLNSTSVFVPHQSVCDWNAVPAATHTWPCHPGTPGDAGCPAPTLASTLAVESAHSSCIAHEAATAGPSAPPAAAVTRDCSPCSSHNDIMSSAVGQPWPIRGALLLCKAGNQHQRSARLMVQSQRQCADTRAQWLSLTEGLWQPLEMHVDRAFQVISIC